MNIHIQCIRECVGSLARFLARFLDGWAMCVAPIALSPQNTLEYTYTIEFVHDSIEEHWIDYLYDELDREEYVFHQHAPRLHAHYIGSVVQLFSPKCTVLGSAISPHTFFQYPIETVDRYLTGYDVHPTDIPPTHIVQIVEPFHPGFDMCLGNAFFYSIPVVIKTYWIRIIQRTWKRVYREKHAILQSLIFRRTFEYKGRLTAHLPSLRGMLQHPHYLSNVSK
jgi:hypothetical protein